MEHHSCLYFPGSFSAFWDERHKIEKISCSLLFCKPSEMKLAKDFPLFPLLSLSSFLAYINNRWIKITFNSIVCIYSSIQKNTIRIFPWQGVFRRHVSFFSFLLWFISELAHYLLIESIFVKLIIFYIHEILLKFTLCIFITQFMLLATHFCHSSLTRHWWSARFSDISNLIIFLEMDEQRLHHKWTHVLYLTKTKFWRKQ